MKKEEKEYLINVKKSLGKCPEQAYREIIELENSRTDFKEYKKEINNLKNTIKKLENQLEKERNKKGLSKDFKTQFNLDIKKEKMKEIKNSNCEVVTIKDLNRILSLLDEGAVGLSELSKICCLKPKICKSALSFLLKNNIIKQYAGKRSVMIERRENERI